ncbi:MAG: ABC transporter permease subunit [Rhodospirillales bacterium]
MWLRDPVIGTARSFRPNVWDLALLPPAFAVVALLAWAGMQMHVPYDIGDPIPLSLDPAHLPAYLLRSALRMLLALALSLLFTLTYAPLAAKVPALGRVMIPLLDILQSIPILGFLSITVTGFIALFPGNLLGVECAAIFAVFTSQAWNMAFSLYASLRTVPGDLREAASMLHLSAWRRFWRLELPFAAPGLIWNMMMSVSGGWFFVVASEAISVSGQTIMLPGIGSYIALAIQQRDMTAIGWAIFAVFIAILIYDQLFFRPLVAWADKFKFEQQPGDEVPDSWLLTLMQRARLPRAAAGALGGGWSWLTDHLHRQQSRSQRPPRPWPALPSWGHFVWNAALALATLAAAAALAGFVHAEIGIAEVGRVLLDGCATALRVIVLILLASLIWVPIGVWIGLRPKLTQRLQPVAQFLAAFPANLLFPLVVMLIVHFDLNVDIWTSPLMVLGTQWYILFNVIAGAASLPADLRDAAGNLGLRGLLRWRRFILPGIFPAYLTGAITASGGSWNASIVAEMVSWGQTTLVATGLGAYIARATAAGDFPRVALGISVMCLFVMVFNRFIWRRLYDLAAERLHIG